MVDLEAIPDFAIFHVGFVVTDLEASKAALTEIMGLSWASVMTDVVEVHEHGRAIEEELSFTYSLDGPPFVELIESRQAVAWTCDNKPAGHESIHHVGMFVPDVSVESRRLAGLGCEVEVSGRGKYEGHFAYHLGGAVPRLELVRSAQRPDFEAWLSGGDFLKR